MKIGILSCAVFEPELEKILSDIKNENLFDENIDVTYLPIGLHIDLDKLEYEVTNSLDKLTVEYDKVILLYGSKCHYRFFDFLKKYDNIIQIKPANCSEAIIGDKVVESYAEGKNIYLTCGTVKKYDELSNYSNIEGNYNTINQFGMYENAIIGNTGVMDIDDDTIFELFDKIQIPIEVEDTDINIFKDLVIDCIKEALV